MAALRRKAVGAEIELGQRGLAHYEQIIERGLDTFIAVGNALIAIHDGKLYREGDFATFGEYCQRRWDFTPQHALRLMQGAKIAEIVTGRPRRVAESEPIGSLSATESEDRPPTAGTLGSGISDQASIREWQLRPLTKLSDDPEQIREAWATAIGLAAGEQPTAKQVEHAVVLTQSKTPEAAAERERQEADRRELRELIAERTPPGYDMISLTGDVATANACDPTKRQN